MNIIDKDVVDVVFEDGWFVDGRKVSRPGLESQRTGVAQGVVTYPLVKTFKSEVFPHAPSPLETYVSAKSPSRKRLAGAVAMNMDVDVRKDTKVGCKLRFDPAQTLVKHSQQHQLPLHCLAPSAQCRHFDEVKEISMEPSID